MSRPRLLDLFCGAGGAAVGYHRAGFDIVGVDIKPQPNYPFDFHLEDALEFVQLRRVFGDFDAIHASPPCQWYSAALKTWVGESFRARHTPMIDDVRDLLVATGRPYVIENVEGARKHMREPMMLCGSSFDLHVRRHRLFETNFALMGPPCVHGLEETRTARYITSTTRRTGRKELRPFVNAHATGARYNTDNLRDAMGVDWMVSQREIREAIPPVYTELIGHQLLQHIQVTA